MEGDDPRTDGELLVATATDPEAFATFYRRHVRGLLAFFRRRGAQQRGWSEDRVRRALGMAPIVLTDEGIERIEALAGAPAGRTTRRA
jgi:hypothetical protein